MSLETLNNYALDALTHYQNLKILGQTVTTPYIINNVEKYALQGLLEQSNTPQDLQKKIHKLYKERKVPFGWYRGKGTPKQLEETVVKVSQAIDYDLSNATNEGIYNFMQLYGIGVDCSGFVYNVLYYAFEKMNQVEKFTNNLAWVNPEKQGASYAGTFVFADPTSILCEPSSLQPLDLLLLRENSKERYPHIALIVKKDGQWLVTQSTLGVTPTGISTSKLTIANNSLQFHYQPNTGTSWNNLWEKGLIEHRRLKILL